METTKEKLQEEAARHKVETLEKKAEVAKAEVQEKVDEIKIGVVDLAEQAQDKWEELKDNGIINYLADFKKWHADNTDFFESADFR